MRIINHDPPNRFGPARNLSKFSMNFELFERAGVGRDLALGDEDPRRTATSADRSKASIFVWSAPTGGV